jgi:hypothetical protein
MKVHIKELSGDPPQSSDYKPHLLRGNRETEVTRFDESKMKKEPTGEELGWCTVGAKNNAQLLTRIFFHA